MRAPTTPNVAESLVPTALLQTFLMTVQRIQMAFLPVTKLTKATTAAELAKSSLVVRAQAYRRQIFAELDRVKEVLLP